MADLRQTAQQALEALEDAARCVQENYLPDQCGHDGDEQITALRAALAQQAERVEPVGRVVSANCEYATVQWLKQTSDVGGGDPKNSRSWPIAGDAVYTAPPQRKPLPKHDQHCVDVPGYGLMAVRLVRAVERAHCITDPQIEDRLARHGIPMPGDPK